MRTLRTVALSLLFLSLAACASKGRVRRETVIGRENIETVMVTGGKVEHPTHGLETWFAIGPMAGVEKVPANGVVQSHVFSDGASVASINLNIAIAPKGFRYVGWLKKAGSLERVRLGELSNPLGDVRHQVIADIAKDLSPYLEADVTLEATGGQKETDPVQATGTMKVRTR